MCGLVGMAGTFNRDDLNAMSHLLLVDSLRGMDSTGIAAIRRDDMYQSYVFKKAEHACDFLPNAKYKKLLDTDMNVFIGHNRHATMGKVNKFNAHPFEFDGLVGAHNGTLKNKHALENSNKFDTDSEALYHNFDTVGVEETMPKVEGAWALTWYDFYEQKLCFLRNDERPLVYCLSATGQALYWASEPAFLTFALKRSGVNYGKMRELPVNTLMRVDVPAGRGHKFKTPLQWERIKLEGKEPVKTHTVGHGYGFRDRRLGGGHSSNVGKPKAATTQTLQTSQPGTQKSTTTQSTSQKALALVAKTAFQTRLEAMEDYNKASPSKIMVTKPFIETIPNGCKNTYTGWKGQELTKSDFEKATAHGCAMCSCDVEWGDSVRFLAHDAFLCLDCEQDPNTWRLINQGAA